MDTPRTPSRRALLAGLAALPLLAACAAEAPTPAPKAPAPPPAAEPTKPAAPEAAKPATGAAPKTEVRMHSRTGTEGTKPEAAIAVFEKANPDITIKLETFPPGEYGDKVNTLGAAGSLGDGLRATLPPGLSEDADCAGRHRKLAAPHRPL